MSNSRWSRSFQTSLAVGISLVLLAGCTGDQAAPIAELERYPEDSALVEALHLDGSLEQMQSYRVLAREAATTCMRERGFDMPMLPVEQLTAEPTLAKYYELDQVTFAEQYGFGILASGAANIAVRSEDDAINDYMMSLEQSEVEAFANDFFGDPIDGSYLSSCSYIGEQAATAVQSNQRWDLYDRFVREIGERIDADPRVVELHQSYSRCMADLGYDYATPEEPRLAASERFADLLSSTFLSLDSENGLRQSLDSQGRDAFDAVESQEIEEALATLECETPIRSALIALSVEIQADWLAENGDRIAAALAEV